MTSSSARAASMPTPGRSVATALSQCRPRVALTGPRRDSISSIIENGIQKSETMPTSVPRKPAAVTPMIVAARLLIVTVRPTMAGSLPKRVFQRSWLSTTTREAPGVSSRAASKPRPTANLGFTTAK